MTNLSNLREPRTLQEQPPRPSLASAPLDHVPGVDGLESGARARQMAQIVEAMPDGIVTISRDWKFTFANRRALEMVDLPDIVGRDIFELFPGNLQEPFQTAYRTAMEQRIDIRFEAFHPIPLNLWLKIAACPYDEGIIVFFSDITQRKQAELRETNTARRLAKVMELTSDAVVSVDREWRFTYLNGNAQRDRKSVV